MTVRTMASSMDAIDYSNSVAVLTENYLKLCTNYELAAMLSKIVGALLASVNDHGDELSDEEIMEFVLTNVMEAKNAF